MHKGLIHIYTGDGKGKTTASVGLAVRASGYGMKVLIVKFLKGRESSEDKSLKLLPNIEIINDVVLKKFTFQMTDDELAETKKLHTISLENAIGKSENVDLIVFDEIISTYNLSLIDTELLLNFLRNKREDLEVVMTGREPSQELIDLADYVSEIKAVKHPYDKGISARKGIEF